MNERACLSVEQHLTTWKRQVLVGWVRTCLPCLSLLLTSLLVLRLGGLMGDNATGTSIFSGYVLRNSK